MSSRDPVVPRWIALILVALGLAVLGWLLLRSQSLPEAPLAAPVGFLG